MPQYDSTTIKKVLDNLLFTGVIIHELAHYLVATLMSSVSVEEVHLSRYEDSYVSYVMYRPRIYKNILLSLAPFYVNTSISVVSIYYLVQADPFISFYNLLVYLIIYYIAISSASKALPSIEDVNNVFDEIRRQLFSVRIIFVLILAPVYLTVTIPVYIIAKIQMSSLNLYYITGGIYALTVLVITIYAHLS